MKPDFALSLSFEGIVLFARASAFGGPDAGWYRMGEVALTVEDLSAAMAELRRETTHATAATGPEVKLILPNEQVRLLSIPAPAEDVDPTESVERALDGATPYKVSELAYDFARSGDQLHIVAVARETLVEAESFALDHDFVPLAFVTIPPEGSDFPREPFLGASKTALTSLTPGVSVEPDIAPLREIPRPAPAKTPVAAPDETALETETPKVDTSDAETDLTPVDLPAIDTGSVPPPPAEPSVEAHRKTEPVAAEAPADASSAKDAALAKPAKASEPDRKASPKAPAAPKKAATKKTADTPQKDAGKTQKAASLPSPMDVPKTAKPAPKPATETASAPSPGFSSIRARRDTPSGSATPVSAHSATPAAARRPVPQPERRLSLEEASSLSGRATASLTERPAPPLDDTDARGANTATPDAAPSNSAGQMAASFASAAMARASTGLGKSIGFVSRRTSARKAAKASEKPAAAPRSRFRPGKGAANAITAENMMEERERMTVFGARQPVKVGGKPPFLGLILTAILLVFLLGVAAWASVFLDGGLANLFGRRETPVVASLTPATGTDEKPETATNREVPLPETALNLPDIDAENLGDNIDVASLSEGVPALSDALVEEQLGGLSVPFEAETLTPEEAEARYAATGIWQRAPAPPDEPQQGILRDLYVASIDPAISQGDAIAIPTAREAQTDRPARTQRNPLPPDAGFEFTDEGLIKPTPEGVVTPDGYTLVLGAPPLKPPARPGETLPEAQSPVAAAPTETDPGSETASATGTDTGADTTPVDPTLSGFRPRSRPDDLIESNERANLGGISLRELAAKRPRVRPEVSKEKAAGEADETATEFAVARSLKPSRRPAGFAKLVERAQKNAEERVVRTAAAVVKPRTVTPRIPSKTNVAREATVKNAINLRRVNLIGVYGKPSARRALVRLSNGRYKKVKIGDRIDGGRVSAIGEDRLNYTKSGRSVVLKMPRG